jgi:ribonuclease HII
MSNVNIAFDEVGRGALCGPLTSCCVLEEEIFPVLTYNIDKKPFENKKKWYQKVRDSKKNSIKIRESIFENVIIDKINYLVLNSSNRLIDKYGIGLCLTYMLYISYFYYNLKGFKINKLYSDGKIKLYDNLNKEILFDIYEENKKLLGESFYTETLKKFDSLSKINSQIDRIVKGDDLYFAIALASNIAKVLRDRFMKTLDQQFPEFGWKDNKGYGTLSNRQAIKKNLNNQYLRQSFLGKIKKD